MKKLVISALVVALLSVGGTAFAQGKVWDDFSWWGKSGATPAVYKDTGSAQCGLPPRSGYWWWPTEPASNVDDQELWGNRGVVYNMYEEPEPPVETPDVPPPAPPDAARVAPVLNNVLFDFDKAVLKPEGKAECDKAVKSLKDNGKDTLVIEGHTCDVGDEAYNMGLGQRRADAVKNYLVESGVDAGRVTTKSLGETKPAVPNDSPANRKLNRRAVFNYTLVN